MKPFLTRIAAASVALLGGLLLAGCGGGGSSADTTPKLAISSVKVFGDSLQDSGTFGYKFTVQSADNLIYAERIAAGYGQTLCNFFTFTGTTFAPNSKAGCTNFSIGGGRITYTGAGGAANPLNIGTQMATYAAAGSYSASDLVLIDGGGNDAADLVGAYLTIPRDSAAAYSGLLGTLLTPAQIQTALAGGASTTAQIGGTYMAALADKFYASIKTNVLDKGAKHVVVLNIPDITFTPRFQMVLDGIAAASGGGTAGATARAQSQALFQGWMKAYNTQLAAKLAGNDSVVLVDFYTAFQDQVAMPAQFSLTNVKTPACPISGVGSDGLPTYNFPTCTATALSAAPPAGATGGADWWKTYAFADSFHPTLYGHQLTQQLIAKALSTKGWL
ncbi:SGNH/GDSL hydrolase family protein [Roseateles asaccharophilus]|uniref:Phospholipase/lecithinase/hemolysin n=1 Tax=Roseateles asaccharophilus TaxID=582607 RepID=A0ABU2AEY4_9BURK|nr:SGNH/GDSL hydrolase family protein [Roseateles asaccharophilus]MDR7335768.1 phospholipase/lecithinase/hemolysin [Roseateles asaccharophilus]